MKKPQIKLNIKLTERDQKLLVFLAFFSVIVIFIGLIIIPLFNKGNDTSLLLSDAQIEMQEKQQKVLTTPSMKKQKEKLDSNFEKIIKDYYDIMSSTEIDQKFTQMALDHHLVVSSLNISMPEAGTYCALLNYESVLKGNKASESDSADDGTETEPVSYLGIQAVGLDLILKGSEEDLQKMLNECASLEPKARITQFLWQNSYDDAKNVKTLGISLELYMAQKDINKEIFVKEEETESNN